MTDIIIRENLEQYMNELKAWLDEIKDTPLEDMGDFFSSRASSYEDVMKVWEDAYKLMAEKVPQGSKTLLDVGCGAGIELEEIFKIHPNLSVTGVDISQAMLDRCKSKFKDKTLELICGDYFKVDMGEDKFDVATSFQTLHHFSKDKKIELYKKVCSALKANGIYIIAEYIACCDEEETLLSNMLDDKLKRFPLFKGQIAHFDTPLTLEHEIEAFIASGFKEVEVVASINGATMLIAKK